MFKYILLLFLLYPSFLYGSENNPYRVFSDPTAPPRKVTASTDGTDSSEGSEDIVEDGGEQRIRLKIDAIVISKKRSFALVAGSKLLVGDDYRGYTVTAIKANEVVLKKDKTELVFYLIEDVI